ncbi:MAG: alpha-L-fucosidase [Phycisphaeraceae bacterium]|nr:alpha-L-fucosidase [Phycisphaeraceae bacterium]
MAWWREARFGMFIHWGLYAVPGGEWGGKTHYGEWLRSSAQIPLAEYQPLLERFNPVKFDADAVVLAAKNAGMGYIVITTKHHDGFCLFDSAHTEFDVMSTPFKGDIMREMADACRRHGLRIGWYYSIMDWHHPDYLPRREWETDRPTEGADFERYVVYMKAQLRELLTNYGDIGVLWFDGQWEGNWNDDRGRDLEAYVRSLAPDIIVNSRIGRAGGDHGLDTESGMLGDYATPEQFIPDSDPGFDWETCMTMNDHWGYNRADKNFKSTTTLVRNLVDIASKGGNFLLNIGPTGTGEIPPESVNRLTEIGEWWKVNSESIRGTRASPFPAGRLPWGRCTTRPEPDGRTVLFLHVFDWPADRPIIAPGIYNEPVPQSAHVLGGRTSRSFPVHRAGDDIVVSHAERDRRDDVTVVRLTLHGSADVAVPPTISAAADIFIESLPVTVSSNRDRVEIRYTLDGSDPAADSPIAAPITLDRSATIRAACFRGGRLVSPVASRSFQRVPPRSPVTPANSAPGLRSQIFTWDTGDIQSVDALAEMSPRQTKVVPDFGLKHVQPREKHWGVVYAGLIRVPRTAVYEFTTASDDGSRLWIGETLVVDNDKPHSFKAERGTIALAAGLHPMHVAFFENWGGCDLKVSIRELGEAGGKREELRAAWLVHEH